MSSHREAPEISKDPTADNTDVYAFVSPDRPDMVTLIANFIPFELPYGGPNFFEFAEDVQYRINISNSADAGTDVSYVFQFKTTVRNKNTFLYNTGPITRLDDATLNRWQTYSLVRESRHANGSITSTMLATALLTPPCNVGDRSTPKYATTFASAVHDVPGNRKVFAGQRSDAFFVDLGSVFDLAGLRPLNNAHAIPLPVMKGWNGLQGLNCHTIALQVPKSDLVTSGKAPTDPLSSRSVIGVWASASRYRSRVYDSSGNLTSAGGWVQVSRLGNPLVNEVINPMAMKDAWNKSYPANDSKFASYVNRPELAQLLPGLYPGAFPNLAAFNKTGQLRTDLNAVLLTGIPGSVLKAFTTYTGPVQADMLRLNLAVPPTAPAKANNLGVLGGDPAGFPNGRRVIDDVTTIELRAVAGLTLPLTYPNYKIDDVLKGDAVRDGTRNTNAALLPAFPYLGTPGSGYATTPPVYSAGKTS